MSAPVRDEIDELVDWQMSNPTPGPRFIRPIFNEIEIPQWD